MVHRADFLRNYMVLYAADAAAQWYVPRFLGGGFWT